MPGPHPQPPPLHRASAGDGAANEVTPTTTAAANANAAFFMFVTLCSFGEHKTLPDQQGCYPSQKRRRVASHLRLMNDTTSLCRLKTRIAVEASGRWIRASSGSSSAPAAGVSHENSQEDG